MEPLTNIDVAILIGLAISMLVAFVRGFVKEVLSILGLILFTILVFYCTPMLLPSMSKYIANPIMAQVVIFLIIMAVFYTIWIISTDKLISKIRTSTLSFMDRLLGLLFGFLRAAIILGFIFLIIKIVLPEELEEGPLKESKYFMMGKGCSGLIEKVLPEDFVENTFKSVESLNKAEKKDTKKSDKKEESTTKSSKENTDADVKGLPSQLDQEQMNKMFELLVKPEVKTKNKSSSSSKTYNNKETSDLERLIDITTKL